MTSTSDWTFVVHALREVQAGAERLQKHVQGLKDLNDNVLRIGNSFSGMLTAMELNAQSLQWSTDDAVEGASSGKQRKSLLLRQLASTPSKIPTPAKTPKRASSVLDAVSGGGKGRQSKAASSALGRTTASSRARGASAGVGKTAGAKRGLISFSLKGIIKSLPERYHQAPHSRNLELLLKYLRSNPDGVYLIDVVNYCGLPKQQSTVYLSQLMKGGHVERLSRKGLLYRLDPARYSRMR